MTDNTDNTEVPVLEGKMEGGLAIPEKQTHSPGTAGRLAKQPTMSKRNIEAVKQANREIAMMKIDVERYVEKQVQLAYSDDTDEATTAQERVAARKFIEGMVFSGDAQVKGDSGRVQINITGLNGSHLKDVIEVTGEDDAEA